MSIFHYKLDLLLQCRREEAASRPKSEFIPKSLHEIVLPDDGMLTLHLILPIDNWINSEFLDVANSYI